MSDPKSKDRESTGGKLGAVTDCAVDNDSAEAALNRVRHHQLPDNRVGEIAASIDNDDVTGFRNIKRLVDHKIIARASLHRNCRTYHHAAGIVGTKSRTTCRHAAHDIANIGNGQSTKGIYPFCLDLTFTFANAESNHSISPQCR